MAAIWDLLLDRVGERERRALAAKQVREKFPGLVEGSTGWHRAFTNRMRRIRGVR